MPGAKTSSSSAETGSSTHSTGSSAVARSSGSIATPAATAKSGAEVLSGRWLTVRGYFAIRADVADCFR